ncbi:ParB/RepB/Spo0J family partition protein [Streptomyces natalensis]|uniref:ParB/RepB/Spo0J family partition protein n=1 Tax=Streptomyces natalensis TaxID=68242 RepID=UPI000AAB1743|nr:ParB/RepB/Spo0J family partition protein [Streptomyces natalensis]
MNSDVVKVSVDAVRTGDSPRLDGEDEDHARALAELGTGLPPITVHRGTMRVIDGAHRLRAARLLGHTEIAARFYDGDEDDAFVLAVTMNASHGLPLTLADRTAAAARILTARPQLSDRRIGKVTGLSGTTVGPSAAVRLIRTSSRTAAWGATAGPAR